MICNDMQLVISVVVLLVVLSFIDNKESYKLISCVRCLMYVIDT